MTPTKPDTGTAHTPGEWTAEEYASPKGRWFVRANGKTINYPLNGADAHLIAAAPDMRSFLDHDQWKIIDRAIERYTNGEISDLHALGLITAGFLKLDADRQSAIAKATGAQP